MLAAERGHAPCALALLSAGADISKVDKKNKTALQLAQEEEHEDIVAALQEFLEMRNRAQFHSDQVMLSASFDPHQDEMTGRGPSAASTSVGNERNGDVEANPRSFRKKIKTRLGQFSPYRA